MNDRANTPTPDSVDLLPCPFCGGEAKFGQIPYYPETEDSGGQYIGCTDCTCAASTNLRFALGEDVRPLLAEQWNRRATPGVPVERVRALAEKIREYGKRAGATTAHGGELTEQQQFNAGIAHAAHLVADDLDALAQEGE